MDPATLKLLSLVGLVGGVLGFLWALLALCRVFARGLPDGDTLEKRMSKQWDEAMDIADRWEREE